MEIDDFESLVRPDAQEVCNGLDDNCVDGEDDAIDPTDWYLDADGWGEVLVQACEAPQHGISQGGDCDDEDPLVFPDAPKLCLNGIDDDCNGRVDHCLVATSSFRIDGLANGDGLGGSVATGDLDGDGQADLVVGAPTGRGTVYVLSGPLSGETLDDRQASARATASTALR